MANQIIGDSIVARDDVRRAQEAENLRVRSLVDTFNADEMADLAAREMERLRAENQRLLRLLKRKKSNGRNRT